MKAISRVVIVAGLFAALNLHAAPLRVVTGQPVTAQPVQSISADDLATMVEAVAQTPPTPAAEVATEGTFYSAQTPNGPPLPGNINNVPAWNLGGGVWLLDDLNASPAHSMNRAMAAGVPSFGDGGDDGGGGFSPAFSGSTPIDTNALWLEITNVANGWSYFNLHNATNFVYAILSKTNLLAATWNVETELFPTLAQTNVLPFSLQNFDRQNLLVRAEDWTGVTENGNTTPDWWLWEYFGTTALSDTNLDSQGNTLLSDYQNGSDPNIINFALVVTNNYVNNMSALVQLNIASGSPSYYAVSVDDTNYAADANWQTYVGTNLTVNLGLTQGWHDVWIGLKGLPANATQTWAWQRLKLDYTPPALVITNPTNGTVNVPVIQLTGYSPEALRGISYDLSNAAGTATNQLVVITGQSYDTNAFEFTTNYFQGYDIPLTNGSNVITLHATDLTGNLTTLTTNINYVPATNLPVVSLIWPQDGMQISGGSITVQGQVNDPTATVFLTLVDANGNTNSLGGLTGRDGIFYVENVPLNTGANALTLTVTNPAGATVKNFSLIQTNLVLTVNSVNAGDAGIFGTVASGYTVWANGVQATNNGDGTWMAQITPLCVGGGLVAVTAIPNSDNGGNGSGGGTTVNPQSAQSLNTQATVESPEGVFVQSYQSKEDVVCVEPGYEFSNHDFTGWGNGKGGNSSDKHILAGLVAWYDDTTWPANTWPQAFPDGTNVWEDGIPEGGTNNAGPISLPQEHCDINEIPERDTTDRRTADTEMMLATGGPLGSTQQNLWVISASATDVETGQPIPPEQISIGGFGNLDTNGNLYVVLSDNDPDVVTPKTSRKHYGFSVGALKYTAISQTYYPALTDTNRSRTTLGVGEQVSLYFTPTPWFVFDWTTTGGGLSQTNDVSTTFTAPSNAAPSVTVTATIRGGKSFSFPAFTVVEPQGIDHAQITGTNHYDVGVAGVGMTTSAWIAPTSVSFYRVNIMEVGEDATNISGYFTQWTPQQLHHSTADHWTQLNTENQFQDEAFHSSYSSPWTSGSFMWDIPARWQVTSSGVTNSMSGWNQTALIDASGTMTVQKFGHSATRTTNDVITTQ